MKSLMLVGGVLGWGVGVGASFSQGNPWSACFWHGCLAAYLSALLMRWWGRAWRKSLQQSLQEREEAEHAITPAVVTPKVSRP
jgi:hypothetical protein